MLWTDVRMALRNIRRRPGFGATIIGTLGIGIGGATAIFSVIDPLLLRPLPYPEAGRLAEIYTIHPGGNAYEGVHPDVWRTVQETMVPRVFDRMEAGAPRSDVVAGNFEPEYVRANALTPGALRMLGARPLLGRLFDDADAEPGATDVAVVSEAFWRRTLGADAGAVGGTITFGGVSFTVIGVMSESFRYPTGTIQLWFPLRMRDPVFPVRGYEAVGRLREGVTEAAAQVEVDGLAGRREGEAVEAFLWDLSVRPLNRSVTRSAGNTLGLLAGAVACVLLIACANAANLLLVRGANRQTELAVRRSLGATSMRLFRQLVTESMVLSLASGFLGIAVAFTGVRMLLRVMPSQLIEEAQGSAGVDTRILAFSILLSLLTGFVFGAGPALRAARQVRLARASNRTMTASAAVQRAGSILVVAELALSMALLASAGLIAKSFSRLVSVNPGFQSEGLMVANLILPAHRYPDESRVDAFYDALRQRLLGLPGVSGVSISDGIPPRPGTLVSGTTIEAEGGAAFTNGPPSIPAVVVDDGYFDVLGIPLLRGRTFGAEDTRSSPRVAIIDSDLAQLLWPRESPIGHRFRLAPDDAWLTVIGVAGSVRMRGPDDRTARYELYTSSRQETPWRFRAVAVRASRLETLATDIRSAVRSIDPEQPIVAIEDGETRFGTALARQRFVLLIMSVFTAMALLLAAIGTYGVSAFLVAQRRREIGLRIALGATPRSMVGNVLVRGLAQATAGAIAGGLLALACSRFLTSMLYDVQPSDPVTLMTVGAILGGVATAASFAPALRAGRVSPLESLRIE
jgi:predicted permease